MTRYDRDQFGQAWADTNRNGCDTRNDILARDLTDTQFRPGTSGCVVLTGALTDPYTGDTVLFRRGEHTSDDVQIDHVVALGNAWQTGAQQLTTQERTQLANDPLNLLATAGPVNQAKGDSDAAAWLPPDRTSWCAFVARQIAIKLKYQLWVTPTEHHAISAVLTGCPGQPVPGSDADA